MSPDRLFDYLEGTLPEAERDKLENDLRLNSHLQRELSMARRIHAGKRGSREVDPQVGTLQLDQNRASRVGPRVAAAFAGLVALNVLFGIYFIVRHETRNPPGEKVPPASRHIVPSPIMGIEQWDVLASRETRDEIAGAIIVLAQHCGGNATRGLTDEKRIIVLVEIPEEREQEFHRRLTEMTSQASVAPKSSDSGRIPAPGGKKSFRIQILTGANASR